MGSDEDTVIIVSHGGLLSLWNAMFLGLTVESCVQVEIHGPAGGVSHMYVTDDVKRRARRISDMSYVL